tara:strand:- start:39 stop:599 length:561 start_codon:yes stop_codon:yes gene_type:complete
MITIDGTGLVTGGTGGHGLRSPGSVVQTVQTVKTDTFTTTSTTLVDVTGLSASITPTSSSSKVLAHVELEYGGSNIYFFGRLLRDSTPLGLGDANSSHTQCSFQIMTQGLASGANTEYKGKHTSYEFLDSPNTTSSTTYKIQVQSYSGDSRTLTINRSGQDGDSSGNSVAWQGRGSSTLTLMEIAA